MLLLQEESEALYQAAFPDHFEAFADLATMEGEVVPADLEEAGTRPKGRDSHPNDISETLCDSCSEACCWGIRTGSP
jgi:hypothetical protein